MHGRARLAAVVSPLGGRMYFPMQVLLFPLVLLAGAAMAAVFGSLAGLFIGIVILGAPFYFAWGLIRLAFPRRRASKQ